MGPKSPAPAVRLRRLERHSDRHIIVLFLPPFSRTECPLDRSICEVVVDRGREISRDDHRPWSDQKSSRLKRSASFIIAIPTARV